VPTECHRFLQAAAEDLRAGPRCNFQVFDVLNFPAELTQHIADKGEHFVQYDARSEEEHPWDKSARGTKKGIR
jgi:hypothetical protein